MKVEVYSILKKSVGEIDLNQSIFGCDYRPDILNQVVNWQLAKRRLGTHQTKEAEDINASTRKIYAQKGTGRARHGSVKAPQFRGGAVVFGPHFRDHSFKLNKKVRNLGLKVALSHKHASNQLIVLDSIDISSGKTKDLLSALLHFASDSALIVDSNLSQGTLKAAANVHKVDVIPVCGLNVYDILNHKTLIVTSDSIKHIEERLS